MAIATSTTSTTSELITIPYSNKPLYNIINRTFNQTFSRKKMAQLYAIRNTYEPGDAELINSLYKATKKRSISDCVSNIDYKLCNSFVGRLGFGRYYGTKNSLEHLKKDARGTLSDEFYTDVDVVNCHPTLIPQIADRWFGMKMPSMLKYVADRPHYFTVMKERAGFSEDETKEMVLRILYGGAIPSKVKLPDGWDTDMPDEFIKMKDEMKNFTKELMKVSAFQELLGEIRKQRKPNVPGSFTSHIVQTEERKCLESMVHWLDTNGFRVDVLAYDGVQVRKDKALTETELEAICGAIKEDTSYDIQLKIKPFETIKFEEDKKEEEEGLVAEDVVIDDEYACLQFIELLGDDVIKQGGDIYIYNTNIGMWETGKDVIPAAVHRFSSELKFKQKSKVSGEIKLYNYGGVVKNINNMISRMGALLTEEDVSPIQPARSKGCLLFKNGWLNIATKTFNEGFEGCRDKYFTKRIKYNYNPVRNAEMEATVMKTLFRNPYNDDTIGPFYLNALSRAIAGCIEDKTWFSIIGRPDCGKGVMTQLLANTFDEYVGSFNMNNLKYNPRDSADEAKKLAWYAPLIGTRIAIGNEVRIDGKAIDGNLIKTLASGGDDIILRQNFENCQKVSPITTFFNFCNDMPTVAPCDEALANRMNCIPHTKSFVNKKQEDCNSTEMEADPALKDKIRTSEWINAFFWLVMDAYNGGVRVEKPLAVKLESAEQFVVEDVKLKELIEERYTYGTQEDCVKVSDVVKYLEEQGIRMSPIKMSKELKSLGFTSDVKKVDGKATRVYFGLKE